jgi:hypothetical protein
MTEENSISDLQEAVLGLLEDAGIDHGTNDSIIGLIAAAERRMHLEARENDHPHGYADPAAALCEIARCLDGSWDTGTDYRENYVVKSFMDACATLTDAIGLDEIALIEAYERVVANGGVDGYSYDSPIDALPEIAESLEGAWDPSSDLEENWIARAFMIAVGTLRLHERDVPDTVLDAYRALVMAGEPAPVASLMTGK